MCSSSESQGVPPTADFEASSPGAPIGWPDLIPLATRWLEGAAGRLGAAPEDFQVLEVPAYPATGQGDHTFCRLWKRGLGTPEAVERIARAIGVSPGDIGVAGRKDRWAETVQMISVPGVDPARLMALEWADLGILEAVRHPHKLRTGHLAGNRFRLRLRGTDAETASRARAVLQSLSEQGCPNAFGPQRFGARARNVAEGIALLRGRRRGGSRWQRRFLLSALQSGLFNAYLARRMAAGDLGRPLAGEVLQRVGGGFFRCDDPEREASRVASREVVPTGPLFGHKMRPAAQGTALGIEEAVLEEVSLEPADFAPVKRIAPGGRRPLLVWPREVEVVQEPSGAVVLAFFLPPGSYATVVLREVLRTRYADLRVSHG